MRLPRVRFTVRRMMLAVVVLGLLFWPIAEHFRWRDGEKADAASRAQYHARMEKRFLDDAARSVARAVADRERAVSARDAGEKATWARRASEHESAASKAREMALPHTRSKSMYQIGWGIK